MTGTLRGNLFIVAAPSGGGKTSLVKALISELDDIEVSVSHTTRSQRPSEVHEVNYFFVKESEFQLMIDKGDFVEYAEVFGHFYGTSKMQIMNKLHQGIDVILDIDWQGAQQIKRKFPQANGIYILPPSLDALRQRLRERNQDKEHIIETRMAKAKNELSHYDEFDYLVVNEHFENALEDLKSIVVAQRLRTVSQQFRQQKLLSFLLSSK